MDNTNPCPCKECLLRLRVARAFDIHFWGDDCPWECVDYEEWKVEKDGADNDQ